MAEPKKIFSKQNILEKQKLAKEEYDTKLAELRQTFEMVASTPSGEKMFQYLFLLCGGDMGSVRRDKDGEINTDETLLTLGASSVWQTVRYNLTSDRLKTIERHSWE